MKEVRIHYLMDISMIGNWGMRISNCLGLDVKIFIYEVDDKVGWIVAKDGAFD